mmetsp:Transcript_31495/g.67032  ORF Transcript_31495/g.67032 Transcript_31495/m.67032 type:complete len:220 (-) Transcript_31495:1405-2064(-)
MDLVDLEVLPSLELVWPDAHKVRAGESLTKVLLLVIRKLRHLADREDVVHKHSHTFPLPESGVHGPEKVVLKVLRKVVARSEGPLPLPRRHAFDLDVPLQEEVLDAFDAIKDGAAQQSLEEEAVHLPERRQCPPQSHYQLRSARVLGRAEGRVSDIDKALRLVKVDLLVNLATGNRRVAVGVPEGSALLCPEETAAQAPRCRNELDLAEILCQLCQGFL